MTMARTWPLAGARAQRAPAGTTAAPLDTETFAHLYETNVTRTYNHVRARVGDPDLAEDLTAQTFLRAWQSIGAYRPLPGRPFISWLFTIANNLVVDHYRRSRRELVGIKSEPRDGHATDPEHNALTADLRDEIRRALARLKPEHQLIVTLRLVDGLDYTEISVITGKTPGALRVILCRALNTLRPELRRRGVVGL
jgi:RNA polymerase sigma-70 factor (ECF subfamily)